MSIDRLIWAVVVLTCFVVACITALTIWHPGDNTAAITAIIGAVTPAIGALILLLQGYNTAKKVDEAKQETQTATKVAVENRTVLQDVHEKTTQSVEKVEQKVDEVQRLVDGEHDVLRQRIAELEERLRGKKGQG